MKIKPLEGWVTAIPGTVKEITSKSGIILSNQVEKMRFVVGRVIASHPKKWLGDKLVDNNVKVGDYIYFDEISVRDFSAFGKKYFAVQVDKIYGTVELSEEELSKIEFSEDYDQEIEQQG